MLPQVPDLPREDDMPEHHRPHLTIKRQELAELLAADPTLEPRLRASGRWREVSPAWAQQAVECEAERLGYGIRGIMEVEVKAARAKRKFNGGMGR